MADYPITLDVQFPDRLSRLTTFFRFFMVIPQMIVLAFVEIAASVVLFISWWAILFIGRYPRWAFDFIAGYLRWITRVNGYYYFLTDKYPPFSMS
jgi:ABC-type multidrug transport system permease subunit